MQLRGVAADIARLFALANERRANQFIADAKCRALKANACSEWWADAECWLAGLDTWAHLRARRARLGNHTCARIR